MILNIVITNNKLNFNSNFEGTSDAIMKDKFKLVGKKIPEFSLPSSRNHELNIRTLEGKNVIIILFRGLHWPYCRWHAAHLRRDLETFEKLNTVLYPILIDNQKNAQKLEQKYARKYPIYYDETKKIAKLLKQERKFFKLGRMPGLLIIDKEGIIRYAYYGDSMKDIPENKILIEKLKEINK